MNTFPENEIEKVNTLLHQLLGNLTIDIRGKSFFGESFLIGRDETLNLLKQLSEETLVKVFRVLSFYYPRWIAYKAIRESDDHYKEYSSNNELLIALTSIIDWLANEKNETTDWKKRFIGFLEENLSKKELNKLIKNFYIIKEKSNREKLKDLKEFADHIYKIRSLVVHNAELGGLYPYRVDFDFENTVEIQPGLHRIVNVYYMIQPEDFRRLLWKAIFKLLGLGKMIFLNEKRVPSPDGDEKSRKIFLGSDL